VKRLALAAALVLGADQLSKWLVGQHLALGQSVRVIGELVRLVHVRNAGAVFGLFPGNRAFFIALSIVSIVAIIGLSLSRRFTFPGSRLGFGVVLGGALGNLVDRLGIGLVVDFIDIGLGSLRWPTFNVADIGITLGVLYLAVRFAWPLGEARTPERGGRDLGAAPGGRGRPPIPG